MVFGTDTPTVAARIARIAADASSVSHADKLAIIPLRVSTAAAATWATGSPLAAHSRSAAVTAAVTAATSATVTGSFQSAGVCVVGGGAGTAAASSAVAAAANCSVSPRPAARLPAVSATDWRSSRWSVPWLAAAVISIPAAAVSALPHSAAAQSLPPPMIWIRAARSMRCSRTHTAVSTAPASRSDTTGEQQSGSPDRHPAGR